MRESRWTSAPSFIADAGIDHRSNVSARHLVEVAQRLALHHCTTRLFGIECGWTGILSVSTIKPDTSESSSNGKATSASHTVEYPDPRSCQVLFASISSGEWVTEQTILSTTLKLAAEAQAEATKIAALAEADAIRSRGEADGNIKDDFARQMGVSRMEVRRVEAFGNRTVFVPTETNGNGGIGSAMALGLGMSQGMKAN
ncbi:9823_t:CDS:2 [Acaulospora colombiana]|uniref:9823_t:CDS:1 n=1 Tax=Acaulospora colombiana TaxID=27376 RepID=A0ACA9N5S2_9GLOM|nr:9823_t:CDS:2 [Acaulospora colombiana]